MNNPIVRSHLPSLKQSKKRQAVPSLQLVVFGIRNLKFAVPIQMTYKVLPCDTVYSSGLNHMGITHVDGLEITVIDLHRRLFKSNQFANASAKIYLVVVQNSMKELCGIPTTDVPTLMEVPLSMIRALPESYRHADTLDVASHVAVIPQESTNLTLFLLDVEQFMPTSYALPVNDIAVRMKDEG